MDNQWRRAALKRRLLLFGLIVGPSLLAAWYMTDVLPYHGRNLLEKAIIAISAVLMAWISLGFWTAIFGFISLLRRVDRFGVAGASDGPDWLPERVKTAVLMPICNEEVTRVLAGLQTTYESLRETGWVDKFDFHILSDTSNPDVWVEEEAGWAALCGRLNAFGRIFYRRRQVNLKRKSGNVADFCRRHGKLYKYMIVLDADSVMSGRALVRMVRIMERNTEVGLVQTLPQAVRGETLLARVQQFASQLYGPIFAAGLDFWLLGDSMYWGHNAIIRVEPFMQNCGLPRLSGKPPLGGDVMSHDFVESALLRRSGWEVWLAPELAGSYEEVPTALLDELKRDRRWCLGNMQHLRIARAWGFPRVQRLQFYIGAMSYISALLWLTLLVLGSVEAVKMAVETPNYFPEERCLFPTWPVWSGALAYTLLATTGVLLFLPKLCVICLVWLKQRRAAQFGGIINLIAGVVFEVLFSTILAPVRMLFHSKFVLATLLGRETGWKSQHRGDREVRWGEALRFHAVGMLLALVWGAVLYYINRPFLYWMAPLLLSLLLAAPVTVWSSRTRVGRALGKWGLMVTPAEINPPEELVRLREILKETEQRSESRFGYGFVRAVLDPPIHVLHCGLLRGSRRTSLQIRLRRKGLVDKCLAGGPQSLTDKEKSVLLRDRDSLIRLHREVWALGDPGVAKKWGIQG